MFSNSKNFAEQNLILAGLGLQLGILSKDKVIRAFTEWLFDKSKPLADILIQQKAITAEECNSLKVAVQAHIQKEGDQEKALASLHMVKDLESDLDHLGDDELHQTLDSALVQRKDLGLDEKFTRSHLSDFPDSGKPFQFNEPGSKPKDRFERQHFFDAGNLGELYFAKDTQLNRTVVAKFIKPERANESLTQALFHLEGEVTGALEHPSIVPVYGLGKDIRGRLFYAMRYIRGRKLSRVISDYHAISKTESGGKQEALIDLLQYFQSACLAIEYAHKKGVLHCDIKPDNIMIGDYGEVFVVDWGLVVVHGEAASQASGNDDAFATLEIGQIPPYRPSDTASSGLHRNQGGSRRGVGGTPAYMAPEQLRATFDEDISLIGPGSDIYALGGVLFQILTGKPPHLSKKNSKENMEDFNKRILCGDFPKPTELKSETPKALEAIALKALRLNPEDRYVSARELAEDVKRYLADEPVKVHREGIIEQSLRFARKNKTVVGVAAALLVCVAIGGGLFGVITKGFNEKLLISEREARKNAELAKNNQKIAEIQRTRAVQSSSILVTYLDSGTPSRILKAFIYAFCRPNSIREDMVSAAALTSIPNSFFQYGEKKILAASPDESQSGLHVKLAFAGIYRSRGLLKESLELHNQVLKFAKNNENLDPWERGLVYREYAWTKQILGDFESALLNYDLALNEFQKDTDALQKKNSLQAKEFANLFLMRAFFGFQILDFESASREIDLAFDASDDNEIKNIALGFKELQKLTDKPFTPMLVQNAISAIELIAPGAGKDIDFISIVQILSKKSGITFFGQKDVVSLSKDIDSSFCKYLGEKNYFTLLGECQIAAFLLKNKKFNEGFGLFDNLILKLKNMELIQSPFLVDGILSPYTEFALDLKDEDKIKKIYQLTKDFKIKAYSDYGSNSQASIIADSFFCNSLISMKKYEEAKVLLQQMTGNIESFSGVFFPITANHVLKLLERLDAVDQDKMILKKLHGLFSKRISEGFKTMVRFRIKDRILAIEKKLMEP